MRTCSQATWELGTVGTWPGVQAAEARGHHFLSASLLPSPTPAGRHLSAHLVCSLPPGRSTRFEASGVQSPNTMHSPWPLFFRNWLRSSFPGSQEVNQVAPVVSPSQAVGHQDEGGASARLPAQSPAVLAGLGSRGLTSWCGGTA